MVRRSLRDNGFGASRLRRVAGLVNPANRASALSLRLTGNRLGQVAVPLGAGALAGTAGTAAIFYLTAGLLAAAAASTWRAVYRHPPTPDNDS